MNQEQINKIENAQNNLKKYQGDLLYKYKSLTLCAGYNKENENLPDITKDNVKRMIDIINNKRLYIPKVEDLNDPFEGRYLKYKTFGYAGCSLSESIKGKRHNLSVYSKSGILSVSSSAQVQQLWAYYCDNYTGACLVFKNTGILSNGIIMNYYDNNIDLGCVSETTDIIKINDINLYYKTQGWFPEQEVRLIYSDNELIEKKFLDVSKQLIAVILGHNVEDYQKTIISKVCKDNNIELYTTYLNHVDLCLYIIPYNFVLNVDGSKTINQQVEMYLQANNCLLDINGKLREM